jgi:hypothetical protein
MYQMLLQVAAGTLLFATTAEVNITYIASVAAVARMTAPAVRGLMADIMIYLEVRVRTVPVIPGHAKREPGIQPRAQTSGFRVWSFGPSRNDGELFQNLTVIPT